MKKIILTIGLLLIVVFALPAGAQEIKFFSQRMGRVLGEMEDSGLSAEAIQDEMVTAEDLNATTPGPFHFLKKIVRTFEKTFTFDQTKKADLEIEEAHEELLYAQKIAEENPENAKSQAKAEKALDRFETNIEKAKDRVTAIKEQGAEQADRFLEKIADMQIKQQKVLDNIEDKMPEVMLEKITAVKAKVLEHTTQAMIRVAENKEKMIEKLDENFANQVGSQFREFKNIEMMEKIKEHMPEADKIMIEEMQIKARERFAQDVSALSPEEQAKKFERYMAQIKGNALTQMEILDDFKANADVSDDFLAEIEQGKEKLINKFEEKFRSLADPKHREQLMEKAANGDIEGLRALQQMQENLPEDVQIEIQTKEAEAIEQFKAKFATDPDIISRTEKLRELVGKMRTNPDQVTFNLIKKIEAEMPAEQLDFITSMKEGAQQGFEQKFTENKEKFLARIESFNPEAIAHLEMFKAEAPLKMKLMIEEAINKQVDFTQEKMVEFTDPIMFERFKEKIQTSPEIAKKIETRFKDFNHQLTNKAQEMKEVKEVLDDDFNQVLEKKIRQ